MNATKKAHIRLDIDDVRRAGSVRAAIAKWCEDSDDTMCGVVGSEFETSGPGTGWTVQFTEDDFARRAIQGGAMHYVDPDDGRMVSAIPVHLDGDTWVDDDDNEHDDNDVIHDMGGYHSVLGEWSEDSVVEIVCPSLEEAADEPEAFAEMARAAMQTHTATAANFAAMLAKIRILCTAIEDE